MIKQVCPRGEGAVLEFLNEEIKNVISFDLLGLCELRLRLGARIAAFYLNGEVKTLNYTVTKDDIDKIMLKLTKHSVYLYLESLKHGYITGDNGERVGVCGTCVIEKGEVRIIKEITSLCVRIPREVIGFADPLTESFMKDGLSSTLVISPPGYGKTTFLRDLARGISLKLKKNVLVSDEKKEIFAPRFSFGERCDFMLGADKSFAFSDGVRNLRSDVIISDELSGQKDCEAALNAALSGVCIIASAHANDLKELGKKPCFEYLLKFGIFKKSVIIGKNYSLEIGDI